MKPYQVHLFTEEGKIPEALPCEPVFIYEDKRYLNFLVFDCFYMKNNEMLKEAATAHIKECGISPVNGTVDLMGELKNSMGNIKKTDTMLLFPDEVTAFLATFSVYGPKTTFFIDYETSPSIISVLQNRSVEFYHHNELEHLDKLLSAKSDRVIVVDGLYDWIGKIGPVNEIVKLAQANDCMIIANETNSFGLLGRNGRGFVDLFNLYEAVNIDVGSFERFLGGFGCYVGAKKYLINKIIENAFGIMRPLPQFMLAVNLAGLHMITSNKNGKSSYQTLWKNSRYFISRLKQLDFITISDTPIAVVSFNNNEEAAEFTKRLFAERIIVAQNKERVRLCLSVEHTKEDLDYCLEKFESIKEELGIKKPE